MTYHGTSGISFSQERAFLSLECQSENEGNDEPVQFRLIHNFSYQKVNR